VAEGPKPGAGYSGTPLLAKLGLKPGHRVFPVRAPAYLLDLLGPLPEGVQMVGRAADNLDVVLCFCTRRAELEKDLTRLVRRLVPAGMFWAAWPKKASKVPTDLTEDTVREVALPRGLVDTKVCAIDETWSGLRLVRRRELR
jgi:Protein of unknown function (DUF3052)